jgi:hypothetical protein
VEEREVADTSRIALQSDTSLGLRLLQLVKGLEATVGNSLVGERPETFTGLQLRRVGGRNTRGMPSGTTTSLLSCQPARSSTSTMRRESLCLLPAQSAREQC